MWQVIQLHNDIFTNLGRLGSPIWSRFLWRHHTGHPFWELFKKSIICNWLYKLLLVAKYIFIFITLSYQMFHDSFWILNILFLVLSYFIASSGRKLTIIRSRLWIIISFLLNYIILFLGSCKIKHLYLFDWWHWRSFASQTCFYLFAIFTLKRLNSYFNAQSGRNVTRLPPDLLPTRHVMARSGQIYIARCCETWLFRHQSVVS